MSNNLGTAVFALGGLAIGALVGAGIGYSLHAMMADPIEMMASEPLIIKQELTPEEIMAFCEDEVDAERTKLWDAQDDVEDLEAELEAKRTELENMKAVNEENAEKAAIAAKKWKEMEAEIERLEGALEVAEVQRDEALEELKVTVKALEVQIKETEIQRVRAEHFRDESHKNLWTSFKNETKVEICDRGSQRRHGKCHDSINLLLETNIKNQFMECVDGNMATPLLLQADDKDAKLPSFSAWLDPDKENRDTKKRWYVQFCDPTLPEADDI